MTPSQRGFDRRLALQQPVQCIVELYAARHLVENFLGNIKQFRAVAACYEKTARNFLAAIQPVASVVWLN
jgi:transposase